MGRKRKEMPAMGMLSTSFDNSINAGFVVKLILIVILMAAVVLSVEGQTFQKGIIRKNETTSNLPVKPFLGMGIANQISGNGHGSLYLFNLNLTTPSYLSSVAFIVQKRSMEISGAKFSFSRNLTGKYFYTPAQLRESYYEDQGDLMLCVFGFVQYMHHSLLGNRAEEVERRAQISDGTEWNKVRLSTLEMGLGVEIYIKLYKNIYLKNYLGVAYYHHCCNTEQLYRDKQNQMLVLGTSLELPRFKR